MQIPNDPVVWTILIVVVAAVLGFAIFRRYSVVVRKGDSELRLERPDEQGSGAVDVLSKATIQDSTVGNITGAQMAAGGARPPKVDVAGGAKISNSKVGDVTGVVQQPTGTSDA